MLEDPNKFFIKNFKILREFTINIQYEDGKAQTIDFSKIKRRGWWDKLKEASYFNQVRINELRNLEWPDEHEFMPEALYYWEKYGEYYMKDQSEEEE